ncbi:MAG: hypothetical protein RLY93_12050 [Sumerlaeia bacterium]
MVEPDVETSGRAIPPDGPRKRRRSRPSTGTIFFLVIVFVALVLVFGIGFDELLNTLYGRTGGLILIVMVAEYIILKSTDRTRVYRLENSRLRERHRRDIALIDRAIPFLKQLGKSDKATRDQKEEIDRLLEDIEENR